MKQLKRLKISYLLLCALVIISISFLLSSCQQSNTVTYTPWDITLAATIKEMWTGGLQYGTHDSLVWNSGGIWNTQYTTGTKGEVASYTYKYVAGNSFSLSACSNGEIMQKVANQAYTSGTDPLVNATYTIEKLSGPPGNAIPVKIICTDPTGKVHAGATVQFSNAAGAYGAQVTTGTDGTVMYSKNLEQATSYTLTVNGTAGGAYMTISTSPPPGALGVLNGSPYQFSGIEIYMRY